MTKSFTDHSWSVSLRVQPKKASTKIKPLLSTNNLIISGALGELGQRRHLLWQLKQLDIRVNTLKFPSNHSDVELPVLEELERVIWEYEAVGYSSDTHIMEMYRPHLRKQNILSTCRSKKPKPESEYWSQV